MDTADIFICEKCALPIRNATWAKSAGAVFTCPHCEVCERDLQYNMDVLERRLHELLLDVIKRLFRYYHNGDEPPAKFLIAIDDELASKNPAEHEIDEIKKGILPTSSPSDGTLRHIIRSEKMLSEFSYRSRERRFIARSPTILRHWAALRRKLKKELDSASHPQDRERVLEGLTRDRYVLNLERMSKLIGDNPVGINRDCSYYENTHCWNYRLSVTQTRADHLKEHVNELIMETKDMHPNIKNPDLEGILRFAGNACFITQSDEVVEFREHKTKHLCKYLLNDHILIVLNDLRCLVKPSAESNGNRPLAELVSIHPRKPAAGNLIEHLANGRYLPNCVDLDQLTALSNRIKKEVRL
jgi:hypothetical protein